jgi:hypothetical protein
MSATQLEEIRMPISSFIAIRQTFTIPSSVDLIVTLVQRLLTSADGEDARERLKRVVWTLASR